MSDQLIDFLKVKYGNRIDHPQPIINSDNGTIQKQLDLVDKKISNTKNIGILWTIIGTAWLTLSIYSLVIKTIDAVNILKVGLGITWILSGLIYLYQSSELKRKKIILETILFINKSKQADNKINSELLTLDGSV